MKLSLMILLLFGSVSHAWCQLPWQQVDSGVSLTNYYNIRQANNGSVYAFGPDHSLLLRSDASGDSSTWARVTLPSTFPSRVREWPESFFINGHDMYLIANDTLWWSDDYAISWRKRSSLPFTGGIVQFIPFVNNTLFYLGGGGLYSSLDQGMTWKQLRADPAGTMIPRGAETFVFHKSNVLKSSDGGTTWTKLNTTMSFLPTFRVVLLSNDTFLISNGRNFYESGDAINWSLKPSIGHPSRLDGCEFLIKAPKSDSLFASMVDSGSSIGQLFYSPDGGSSWMDFSQGIQTANIPEPPYALFIANGYVFCSGPTGEIYRTSRPLALSASTISKDPSPCKVYPNPAKDWLIVEGIHDGTVIQLLNMLGQQVVEVVCRGEREVLNTKALVPGSYMLQVRHKDGRRELHCVERQ